MLAHRKISFLVDQIHCRGGGGGQDNQWFTNFFLNHVFVGVIQYHLRPLKCDLNQETI